MLKLKHIKRLRFNRSIKVNAELKQRIDRYNREVPSGPASRIIQSLVLALDAAEKALKEAAGEDDSYVAWLHYRNGTIDLCDSDSEGAFKVWRRPRLDAAPKAGERR